MYTLLPGKQAELEYPEEVEAEEDDEDASDSPHPVAMAYEHLAHDSRCSAEREEDYREAGDKEQRMGERHPARALNVVDAQPGDEADVARNQRQHAG